MKKIFYLISTLGVGVVNLFEDEPEAKVAKDPPKATEVVVDENREVGTEQSFAFPVGEIQKNEPQVEEEQKILVVNEDVDPEILEEIQAELDSTETALEKMAQAEMVMPVLTPETKAKPKDDSTDLALSQAELERLKEEERRQMEEERKISRDIEISGLIMDDTRSKIGRDFYDSFFTQWNSSSRPNEQYTITIAERPVRGSVSQVSVYVNETEIFRNFIQLRTSEIEQRADQAVKRAHNFLLNQDDLQRQLMEETDQMGSGIY